MDSYATKADIKHLEELILHFSDSLGREMANGFDRIDSSVKRHSGMLISGTVAISTLTKTVTRLETSMKNRDTQIRDLKNRVRRLEHRKKAG